MSSPTVFLTDQVAFDGIVDCPGQHRAGLTRHEQIILRSQRHHGGRQFLLRFCRQHNDWHLGRSFVDFGESVRAYFHRAATMT